MPLYEYQCQTCNHQEEKLESMYAARTQTCPSCQQLTLQRMMSNTHFQLKGSGWYVTDFKNPQTHSNNTSEATNAPDNQTEAIDKTQVKTQEKDQGKLQEKNQKSKSTRTTVTTKQDNPSPSQSSNKPTTTSNKSTTD